MQRLQIRKEQLTFWRVENEFWVQKQGYETDDLKNDLRLEVFDQESKPSGFIWLSWIHISFLQQLLVESISSVECQIVPRSGETQKAKVGRIEFKRCVTDCVDIRRKAESLR